MKRIVILIDGTWDEEGPDHSTNVAHLDPANQAAGPRLIRAYDTDRIEQRVLYHKGVGTDSDLIKHWLAGLSGLV